MIELPKGVRELNFSEVKNMFPIFTDTEAVKKMSVAEISLQILKSFEDEQPVLIHKKKDLFHSFYVDPQNKKTFAISGLIGKELYRGGNKCGRPVVMIDSEGRTQPVIKLSTLAKTHFNAIHIGEIPEKEIEIAKRYSGQSGFVTLYGSFCRQTKKYNINFEKRTLFVEKFHGNLNLMLHKASDMKECLFVAIEVAKALKIMHDDGYVHGDIDGQNILVSYDKERHICKAALWDFGLAKEAACGILRYEDVLECPWEVHNARNEQYSPESLRHLHDDNLDWIQTDYDRKANDVYAFGLVLYRLFQKKNVSWCESLSHLNVYNFSNFSPYIREDILTRQENIIEEIEKLKTREKTPEQEILLVVFGMLHPDWKMRLTIQQVVNELQSIIVK